ncbi:hypothetical protein LguiA_034088 [Lonicera macranthoides]
MAASAKTLILKPNSSEEWTVVLPRHGKRPRSFPQIKTLVQQEEKQWAPTDIETDPERESKLMQKMQTYIEKLAKSQFCTTFFEKIETPEMLEYFRKVLGSESTMQMVIYGIGSIESFEPPRWQLSLAILMKRKFDWIGNIDVFDPIISLTESRVIESLGCSVLSVNEHGKRKALSPTLFFMPHCEVELYENLLEANWRGDMLNQIVLFGNSFETYAQELSVFNKLSVGGSRKHIMAIRRFVKEFEVNIVSDDYYRAFNGSSFHFPSLDPEVEMPFI